MQSTDILPRILKTKQLESFIKKSDNILSNKKFSYAIIICLIVYVGLILPNLFKLDNKRFIKQLIRFFKDPIYKVIILLLIGYIGYINFVLAIYLILTYAMTLDEITKYELSEQLKTKIINDQNEREFKLELSKKRNSKLANSKLANSKSTSSITVSSISAIIESSPIDQQISSKPMDNYNQNELLNKLIAQY